MLTSASNGVATKLPAVKGTDYGVVVVPVVAYKQIPLGSVVAARHFQACQTQANWSLVMASAVAFLQAVLVIGTLLKV